VEQFLGRKLNEKERERAPRWLYVAGPLPIPVLGFKVSVVGTRRPSDTGRCVDVVKELVKRGVIIVSGLARGIDTIAHKTAIGEGGKTIAVLPTSLDVCYPPENSELLERIKKEYLAISQFPVGSVLRRENFLARNRTMALLSEATVIVEAGERSGTIAQGWECIRLGRPLLGHTSLLKYEWFRRMTKRGAKAFESVDDLVEILVLGNER